MKKTEAQIYADALGKAKGTLEWAHDRLTAIIARARAQGGIGTNALAYDCEYVRDSITKQLDDIESVLNSALGDFHLTILQGELSL